jgi:hypothetical protein
MWNLEGFQPDAQEETTARNGEGEDLEVGSEPRAPRIVGGGHGGQANAPSAELFDPGTGLFTATGPLVLDREDHTATVLPNGKVLIAGGIPILGVEAQTSAELYDPCTGTFTPTGSMTAPRRYFAAALLANGKVLVAGGYGTTLNVASAELYDPGTGGSRPPAR